MSINFDAHPAFEEWYAQAEKEHLIDGASTCASAYCGFLAGWVAAIDYLEKKGIAMTLDPKGDWTDKP